jgi:hypothetical protein
LSVLYSNKKNNKKKRKNKSRNDSDEESNDNMNAKNLKSSESEDIYKKSSKT